MSAVAQITWDDQQPQRTSAPPGGAAASTSIKWDDEPSPTMPSPAARADVAKRSAQPTQFEQENTPSVAGEVARTAVKIPLKAVGLDTNSQSPVSDWLTSLGSQLWRTLKDPFAVPGDVVSQMNATSKQGMQEFSDAAQPGAYQAKPGGPIENANPESVLHRVLRKTMGAADIAASNVPIVGPGLVKAARELANSNSRQETGEAIADLGGTAGQAFLATEPGQRGASTAIEKVGGPVAETAAKVGRVARGEPPAVMVPEASKAFTQAIQPGVNIPRAQESIQIAGPRMQQVRESLPEGAPGKEIRSVDGAPATGQALELNRAAKKQVLQAIDDRIGPVKDLQPDTSSVADAMESSISKRTQAQFPETAARINARAATYRDSGLNLGDVEDSIQDANKSLRNFYKQPTAGESPTSADMDATLAEVGALRKLLDDQVGELGGNGAGDLQGLKREYGALRDVEKALARQHAIATRVKGGGLWEGLAYLHAAGDLVSGNLLGAARAGATIGIGKLLKNLRDPNYLLEQSFHGPKAFEAAEPIGASAGPPQPKALLPAPATPMSGPGPEDTSGAVRGGRWTTPKAALPAPGGEAPIEAKFIRNIQKSARSQAAAPKGLLGDGTIKLPATNIPPLVDPKFLREAIGSVTDPNRLGTRGEGGVRTTPKGELPAMTGLHERARLLIQQTMDTMRSGDRPGRYYDQNELGDYNTQGKQTRDKGLTSGGKWRGVKSMRDMLPWANENEFSPTEMEQALKMAERGKHNRVFNDALAYVKREAAKAGRGAVEREPGEDETPF